MSNDYGGVNNGIINSGPGTVNISNSAFGYQPTVSQTRSPRRPSGRAGAADVGVLTVLSVEMRAVVEALRSTTGDYQEQEEQAGLLFHRATVNGVRVVATQSVSPGQRSAAIAFGRLRDYWAPPVVVLVGIAGGIHPTVGLGDVVVSTEVIYYDMRKETATGARRRGQTLQAPPVIGRKVNAFFARYGVPLRWSDPHAQQPYQVVPGPIGSGEAVVAYQAAEARGYLADVNDKVLALETEAGGVAQAFYEDLGQDRSLAGWLTVRGVSDRADGAKDDSYHGIAARHAADVLVLLLPFLMVGEEAR